MVITKVFKEALLAQSALITYNQEQDTLLNYKQSVMINTAWQ